MHVMAKQADPRAVAGPCRRPRRPAPCGPPAPGEVRFYKKIGGRRPYDIVVRVADCGCNRWRPAFGADKAAKGIARLEGGRADWRTLEHCGSCTGGGMWRVRW